MKTQQHIERTLRINHDAASPQSYPVLETLLRAECVRALADAMAMH